MIIVYIISCLYYCEWAEAAGAISAFWKYTLHWKCPNLKLQLLVSTPLLIRQQKNGILYPIFIRVCNFSDFKKHISKANSWNM